MLIAATPLYFEPLPPMFVLDTHDAAYADAFAYAATLSFKMPPPITMLLAIMPLFLRERFAATPRYIAATRHASAMTLYAVA